MALPKMLRHTKGAVNVFSIVLDVALVLALYPTINGFIATAQSNMTSPAEIAISALIPLVVILALVWSVVKQSGVSHMGGK